MSILVRLMYAAGIILATLGVIFLVTSLFELFFTVTGAITMLVVGIVLVIIARVVFGSERI